MRLNDYDPELQNSHGRCFDRHTTRMYYYAVRGLNCATLLPTPRTYLCSTHPAGMSPTYHFEDIDEAMNWHIGHSPDGPHLLRLAKNEWIYKGRRVIRIIKW